MTEISRPFQIFVKPAGARCNMGCRYCYYLKKRALYPEKSAAMPEILLEEYIVQHIEASPEPVVRFSWHGGEPTILGLDYFRRIRVLQKKHLPAGRRIANGLQTNGSLLDDDWGRFFAEEGFAVGLSLDGPRELHDRCRVDTNGKSSFTHTMRGYEILRRYGVPTDILCVVNDYNVRQPAGVYQFFKSISAEYLSFLPCVERSPEGKISTMSVSAEVYGRFLCTIFDAWLDRDISRIKIQIFEEAARTAFKQEHSLCIFRPVCGDIPVLEHNGDLYSCDHYVDKGHHIGNIIEIPLGELLESPALRDFGNTKQKALPQYCRLCEVLDMCNGGCPKNRFLQTPEGEEGLNYLCAGYKRFFNHCRPWVNAISEKWRLRNR
jgi:uncharacterized protein